jgi:DNA-binding GntR family transcriptional regulator
MLELEAVAPADKGDPSVTLVERATALIHRDILAGLLEPEARLRVHDLVARYRIGATPIREALSRLGSEGLVQAIGNRGFRVMGLAREDLEDIIRTRCVIEIEALRLSMANGGDEWEAEIVAALHRLQRFIERSPVPFHETHHEYDRIHRRFHTALIAACGSPRLLALHRTLYDQTYRYRAILMSLIATPRRTAELHIGLADVVLARNVERASEALAEHIGSTLEVYGARAGSRLGGADAISRKSPNSKRTNQKGKT